MEVEMKRELAIYVNQLDSDFERFINLAAEAGFECLCTQDSIEWLDLSKEERMRKIENTKETVEKHGLKFPVWSDILLASLLVNLLAS